jgi:hypothetical protein
MIRIAEKNIRVKIRQLTVAGHFPTRRGCCTPGFMNSNVVDLGVKYCMLDMVGEHGGHAYHNHCGLQE